MGKISLSQVPGYRGVFPSTLSKNLVDLERREVLHGEMLPD
jgi:hypothetical protein